MSCCEGKSSPVKKPKPRETPREPIEKEIIVRYRTPEKTVEKSIKKEVPVDDDFDEIDLTTGGEYTFKCYENQKYNPGGDKLKPDVAGSGYDGTPCPLICLLDEVDKKEKVKVMTDLKNYQQKRRKLVLTASMLYRNNKK